MEQIQPRLWNQKDLGEEFHLYHSLCEFEQVPTRPQFYPSVKWNINLHLIGLLWRYNEIMQRLSNIFN